MAKKAKPEEAVGEGLQSWLDDVAAYERAFKKWEGRVDKILRKYQDDARTGSRNWTEAKFNILWSNVQTLSAATFSRLPKPDVSRRFRDQDPVGRVASMLLERALDYHVQHYPEYRVTLEADVLDRFLGGRGTAWVRYEPHFRAAKGQPVDGDQITEDVDTPNEELDYECVAVDYVHWKDFGHSVARTWEEVGRVWRKVYMTREALIDRFGDIGNKVPLDADPRQGAPDKAYGSQNKRTAAMIYEGWDKEDRKAVWFSKSVKEFLDAKDDPLGLEDVFPCPKPLYATLCNESLEPTPDYIVYQDQANELDLLADKIDGLVKALKVCGGYDASIPELQRIFTEGENGTLIPVKNWQAFAEKNGLQGALSLVDLNPIAQALQSAYEAFVQIKEQIYELTGISDIIRGQTQASETATAQQIKGQYASLRLRTYQNEVSRFASDILSLMAQVMCRKFSPQTLMQISGAELLSPQDQEQLQQAMLLLIGQERMANPDAEEGPNPVREFRIEVAADSMVQIDEQAEQQARTEFLTATGTYLQNVATAMQGVPQAVASVMIPLLMDMLKFGVTGFKIGKQIEGAFDEAAEKLKQIAQQPPPPPQPNPDVQIQQMKMQGEMQRAQMQNGLDREKMAAEVQLEREKMAAELQFEREKHQQELQAKLQMSKDQTPEGYMLTEDKDGSQIIVSRDKKKQMEDDDMTNQQMAAMIESIGQAVQMLAQANAQTAQLIHGMHQNMQTMTQASLAPKQVMKRDANGRIEVVAPVLSS